MRRNVAILFVLIAVLFVGCAKFEPPILTMKANYDPFDQTVTCTVTIIDNGGCTNFTEQGGIVSLNSTPSHLDQYSVVEVYENNSTEMIYTYETKLSQENVTYYLRAFVKTNAGTGYSNIISVSTVD
jgi:hypothetical protein